MSQQKRKRKRKNNGIKHTRINSKDKKEWVKQTNKKFFVLKVAICLLALLAMTWLFKKEINIGDIFEVLFVGFVWSIVYFLSPIIYKTTYKQATKPLTNGRVLISCLAIDIFLQATFTLTFYLEGWIVAAILSFFLINGIFIWIFVSGKKAGRF